MNSSQDLITNFLSDDDFLILEDELGRVTLKADQEQISQLSTGNSIIFSKLNSILGVIVGIFGNLDENGEFIIKKLQFAEIQPQKTIKPKFGN